MARFQVDLERRTLRTGGEVQEMSWTMKKKKKSSPKPLKSSLPEMERRVLGGAGDGCIVSELHV